MKVWPLGGRALSVAVGVVTLFIGANASASPKVGFEFGLIFSSGYSDTLDDWANANGYESSGGYGWLDLGLKVDVPLAPGLSLVPAGDFLMNFIAGDESAMNMIVLPSISVRYQFVESSGPYIQVGLNYGIVNMGLDDWDVIDSDGIGIQAQVGYQFEGQFAVELGYVKIPVAVDNSTWDEDFGGVQIRGVVSF